MARFLAFGFLILPIFSVAQVMDTAAVRVEVDSLMKLCSTLTNQRKLIEALQIIEPAIKKSRAVFGVESSRYADCIHTQGTIFYRMGKYAEAKPLWLESKFIREKLISKDSLDYATNLSNLGVLYFEEGEYNKAELLSLEAKEIRGKILGKEHPDYAQSLNNLAVLYKNIGAFDKAEPLYLEAKAIREKVLGKDHPDYARSLNNLAILYRNKGDFDKAEPLYLEAKAIREKVLGKEHPDYARCLNNLANLYLDIKDYNKAEELYLESKAIRERVLGKEHPEYAQILNNLANLYYFKGEYYKAEPFYLEGKAIREKTLGKNHPYFANSLKNLAYLYRDLGQFEKSQPYYIESSSIHKHNFLISITYLSIQELENQIAIYQDENDNLYSFNHQTSSDSFRIQSYNNALFYKSFVREIASQLELAMQSAPDSIRSLHVRWKGYNRQLAAEIAKPIAERKHLVYLDSMSTVLEKVLLRAVPTFAESHRQIEWQEVRDALHSGEAAIEFIHYRYSDNKETDSTMYSALITIPGGNAPQFIPLFEAKQLDVLVYKADGTRANYLQNLYATPRKDGLTSLYQLLWTPIEKVLQQQNIKTVYYSPTGMLHRLNLSAIADGNAGPRLADNYHLVPMGSTRQLTTDRLTRNSIQLSDAFIYGGVRYEMDSSAITRANAKLNVTDQDSTGGLFGFAMHPETQRGENWEYLPGTEIEARHLEKLLHNRGINTTLQLGYEATEESFKQIGLNTPSPSLLHIGTHGFFFPDPKGRGTLNGVEPVFKVSDYSMIRSGLKMAGSRYAWENGHPLPGGHEDGILTAYEVSQMNLSNTQLVVLSACETGLGDIKGNEGVYGLQRAFRIAGAKNVLMSLWKVPDDATEKLMTRFYSNWLREKKPLRESFDEAQKWLRGQKGFENPYYWAGFVLI